MRRGEGWKGEGKVERRVKGREGEGWRKWWEGREVEGRGGEESEVEERLG